MNAKTLISGIILLIAVCLGIYFWAEWQKARFDESLPTPPPADEQAGGHWHGDEWHADDAHTDETELIPSVDWEPSTGRPHEAVKPEGLDTLDAEDPVAKAWAQLDYIADNPFAWGGTTSPRTAALVQQLMPPIMYFESEAHAEEILGLLKVLAYPRDPRSIETLVVNMCEGPGRSRPVIDALVDMGPPVVPHLISYLDEALEAGEGSVGEASRGGMATAAYILSQVGPQHRADLGGIVEHIILPKLELLLADGVLDDFWKLRVEEAIARLTK